MKYRFVITCFILSAITPYSLAQQWTGSPDANGQIERNGNTKTNGLIFGRYGTAFLGDSNPYALASVDSELHDLLVYGNGSATLNLRLYDGDLKFGSSTIPNAVLYNSGNAFFNGKIGIGTTTLNDALNIYKEGLASMSLWTNTANTRLSFRVHSSGRDGYITYQNDGRMSFNLDDSNAANAETNEYMTILPNGNVGLGIASPSARLEVAGQNARFFSGTGENTLSIGRNSTEQFSIKVTDMDGFIDYSQDDDTNGSHVMYIRNLAAGASPNNDIRFQTGGLDRVTLKTNGRLGVGTLSPRTLLHVQGDNIPTVDNVDASEVLRLTRPGSGEGQQEVGMGIFLSKYSGVNANSYSRVDFRLSNIGSTSNGWGTTLEALAPTMSLLGNGNVGIGTTNPNQKLTVNGTIYSTEVKVDVNAGTGPDYVFEPTYQLPSLTEIENYIKTNKHLPEVPSAKEMETNGINLSEMNMLLLKKVEELTLHLIEANKRIDYLTKRIDEKN